MQPLKRRDQLPGTQGQRNCLRPYVDSDSANFSSWSRLSPHHTPAYRLQMLLVRHTPEELEAMVAIAVELIDGAAEAVEFAQQRRELCKVCFVPPMRPGSGGLPSQ